VEMPGINGLELASQMLHLEQVPAIIFVTAHDHYAVDAFDVEAADYVVKPVRQSRLRQALDRIKFSRDGDRPWLAARIGERLVRIALDRVRAFTTEDKCTVVHSVDAQARIDEPLISIEAQLGDRFVRVHRNALVSRNHLRAFFTDRCDVARVQIEGIELNPEVSRRNQTAIKKMLTGSR